MRHKLILLALASLVSLQVTAAEPDDRLAVRHWFEIGRVSEPQLSPEGEWIAYTVSRDDLEEDKTRSRIWTVPTAGGEALAMTAEGESSSHPRWSPDGRWLAFLSARDEGETQVWLLRRSGGEAEQLTDTAQSVQSFAWSPDGKRMVLVLQDPTPQQLAKKEQGEAWKERSPGPWVIDREMFKEDYVGYLDRRRTHLYVLDLADRKPRQLTGGDFDDKAPAWSPDGSRIAFVSNRSATPDLNYNTDIWTVPAQPQDEGFARLEQLTTQLGADDAPQWSPDGASIVHTAVTAHETHVYGTQHLAVAAADGSGSRVLSAELDRMVFQPRYSADGQSILFLLEDSGEQALARMPAVGGAIERLVAGQDVVRDFDAGSGADLALIVTRPHLPAEVFSWRPGALEQRSTTNREALAGLGLGEVIESQFTSSDGAALEGFIIRPPGWRKGKRHPAILRIHGGPQSQYDFGFHFEAQLLAANGYVVVMPNPRGSTGYGQAFCLAIWQDWGGPDFLDVMAAVDDAVERGWADPERLGVMGWSYGGILTNHVLTKTDRFKAASSGASEVLYVVNYGHDQYLNWWEQELGKPWEPESRALWERMSPFNRVDRITTPTLVLGGEEDWNVPIINSEQLYLALKRLGVETQLVVYPGEYHGIDKPSHVQDLFGRYLDWFGARL